VCGLAIALVFVGGSLLAPIVAPYPPAKANYQERLLPPSPAHLMGTDAHGRDTLSRLLYGGRVSLKVGFWAVVLSTLVGLPLGQMAGFFGGHFDTIIGRITDALFAFPSILWAIAIVAILGPSERGAILAIAVSRIALTIRISRGAVLSERGKQYVEASRALGSSWPFVVFRGVLPNCAGTILVLLSLGLAVSVLAEAGLSFLGMSAQPPTPSWGSMLQESQRYLYESPWFAFFPGMTVFLVVLGLNLLGDGIRDLLDPRREWAG